MSVGRHAYESFKRTTVGMPFIKERLGSYLASLDRCSWTQRDPSFVGIHLQILSEHWMLICGKVRIWSVTSVSIFCSRTSNATATQT